MKTATKVGAFTLAVAALFGGAYGLGQVVGPMASVSPGYHAGMGSAEGAAGDRTAQLPAGGLLVAQDGYRLQLVSDDATTNQLTEVAFRILGPQGEPVTSFTSTHEKAMHLILARRDLSGFQHVHPTMDPECVVIGDSLHSSAFLV